MPPSKKKQQTSRANGGSAEELGKLRTELEITKTKLTTTNTDLESAQLRIVELSAAAADAKKSTAVPPASFGSNSTEYEKNMHRQAIRRRRACQFSPPTKPCERRHEG